MQREKIRAVQNPMVMPMLVRLKRRLATDMNVRRTGML